MSAVPAPAPWPRRIGSILLKQWFMVVMAVLFLVARQAPQWPAALNAAKWPQNYAIMFVFFVSGFCLKTEDAWRGLAKWRLHLYVQAFSFLLFPAAAWLLMRTVGAGLPEGFRIGIFILAVLPTTITSCAILTQLAGGDFAAALFNAVAGNFLGVFVSPLLLIFLLGASATSVHVDTLKVFLYLSQMVIAPLIVGQVCHQFAREASAAFRKKGMLLNNFCVLFIVFLAFGSLFTSAEVRNGSVRAVLLPLLLIVVAHWGALAAAALGARLMGWPRADRLAALFCASQKTLALGLPMVKALLDGRPELIGLASLPIIVYHPTQLLTGALLAQRKG